MLRWVSPKKKARKSKAQQMNFVKGEIYKRVYLDTTLVWLEGDDMWDCKYLTIPEQPTLFDSLVFLKQEKLPGAPTSHADFYAFYHPRIERNVSIILEDSIRPSQFFWKPLSSL